MSQVSLPSRWDFQEIGGRFELASRFETDFKLVDFGRCLDTPTAGERVKVCVPFPLPPSPPVDLCAIQPLLERANQAIGRLDGAGPNPAQFRLVRLDGRAHGGVGVVTDRGHGVLTLQSLAL